MILIFRIYLVLLITVQSILNLMDFLWPDIPDSCVELQASLIKFLSSGQGNYTWGGAGVGRIFIAKETAIQILNACCAVTSCTLRYETVQISSSINMIAIVRAIGPIIVHFITHHNLIFASPYFHTL